MMYGLDLFYITGDATRYVESLDGVDQETDFVQQCLKYVYIYYIAGGHCRNTSLEDA